MGFFSQLFGKEQGPKCKSCKKTVVGRDSLMATQSYAIQAGLAQRARELEKTQAYVCKNCGNLYCKACLEKHVSDSQQGAMCPGCGGSFAYLP